MGKFDEIFIDKIVYEKPLGDNSTAFDISLRIDPRFSSNIRSLFASEKRVTLRQGAYYDSIVSLFQYLEDDESVQKACADSFFEYDWENTRSGLGSPGVLVTLRDSLLYWGDYHKYHRFVLNNGEKDRDGVFAYLRGNGWLNSIFACMGIKSIHSLYAPFSRLLEYAPLYQFGILPLRDPSMLKVYFRYYPTNNLIQVFDHLGFSSLLPQYEEFVRSNEIALPDFVVVDLAIDINSNEILPRLGISYYVPDYIEHLKSIYKHNSDIDIKYWQSVGTAWVSGRTITKGIGMVIDKRFCSHFKVVLKPDHDIQHKIYLEHTRLAGNFSTPAYVLH